MTAVPIAITVRRFQCPHCRRTRGKKQAAVAHMARCWKNPANQGCKTCAHHQEERWSSHRCHPSIECGCDSWPEACCHPDGPEPLEQPIIHCPLWQARTEGAAV